MKNELYETVKAFLKRIHSHARYEHSLEVSVLAGKLGKRHGWNKDRAQLAGLLHDCAKEWSPKMLLTHVKKHRLKIPNLDFILKNNPNMMHAYVGADVAKRAGWLTNENDLNAIRSHTLGRVPMSKEEKILFIADFAAPGRKYKSAKFVRKVAKINLKEGFREAVNLKLQWQLRKTKPIHPMPIAVWNHLICKMR